MWYFGTNNNWPPNITFNLFPQILLDLTFWPLVVANHFSHVVFLTEKSAPIKEKERLAHLGTAADLSILLNDLMLLNILFCLQIFLSLNADLDLNCQNYWANPFQIRRTNTFGYNFLHIADNKIEESLVTSILLMMAFCNQGYFAKNILQGELFKRYSS